MTTKVNGQMKGLRLAPSVGGLDDFRVQFQVIVSVDSAGRVVVQMSQPAPLAGVTDLLLQVCRNNMAQMLKEQSLLIVPGADSPVIEEQREADKPEAVS